MILSLYLTLACGVPRPVSKGGKEFFNGCIFFHSSWLQELWIEGGGGKELQQETERAAKRPLKWSEQKRILT